MTSTPDTTAGLADMMRRAAIEAGVVIMPFFRDNTEVRQKDDASPVTDADEAAEKVILEALKAAAPDIPVIAEESVAAGHIPDIGSRFFLVDPLDGTKEFISGRGEFTVNIALIEDGKPIAGVVYAPALSRLFYGVVGGETFEQSVTIDDEGNVEEAALKPIESRMPPADGMTAVASRSHRSPETDDYLSEFEVKSFVSIGSSLKFCLVATGEADIYPRHGRTMEWDTAAGHAVLLAAGGSVNILDSKDGPLAYGKSADGFANPFFVARGRES